VGGRGVPEPLVSSSAVPHPEQNLAFGSTGIPHSEQNFREGFNVGCVPTPQRLQFDHGQAQIAIVVTRLARADFSSSRSYTNVRRPHPIPGRVLGFHVPKKVEATFPGKPRIFGTSWDK